MEKNISNKPVILFRKNVANKVEYEQCSALFSCYSQRTAIPADSVVIGRYSVLPYYNELENDLAVNNCSLINNLYEHEYIANMDYYYDIAEHTFPTWFRMEDIPFSLRERASRPAATCSPEEMTKSYSGP